VDVLPLLPAGTPIFTALPAAAVVLDALPRVVGDGAVVVRAARSAGVMVIRAGRVERVFCVDGAHSSSGREALSRIASWTDATITASKLTQGEVDLLPELLGGDPYYSDLRLQWTDWAGLLGDLRQRAGSFVIELSTPTGRGITCLRDGEHIATYSDSHPQAGDLPLLDGLLAQGTGSIRVLIRAPEAPAPALRPLDGEQNVAELLPDLKLLARSRLQLSSRTVEVLLEDAASSQSTLEEVARDVRTMSIRGVMRPTLEQLADEMLELSSRSDV
jgi:hypothetical protein